MEDAHEFCGFGLDETEHLYQDQGTRSHKKARATLSGCGDGDGVGMGLVALGAVAIMDRGGCSGSLNAARFCAFPRPKPGAQRSPVGFSE